MLRAEKGNPLFMLLTYAQTRLLRAEKQKLAERGCFQQHQVEEIC